MKKCANERRSIANLAAETRAIAFEQSLKGNVSSSHIHALKAAKAA